MRKRYEENALNPDGGDDEHDEELAIKTKSNIHSVSFIWAYVLCAFFVCVFALVLLIDSSLPTPLKVTDEQTYPNAFIAERAHHDLKLLTDIGTRVTGSYENEMLAVEFLKREIIFIQNTKHPAQRVEFDVQTVTGSYYLDYTPNGVVNSYANLQNVVVKLFAANESSNSILVNAHFDSVPTSPGGSDDGINCAVMLELLRKLSRLRARPLHNIVFLFNGAEETPLQASHGFITQHQWAKGVKVVINLDAAGAGGREILFQTGPNAPWLLKYYAKVPHPNGQAAGEELFQSGFIPSDTDFRIFRDFGHTIGYDFAFFKNGYRYHTKYDNFTNIPLGSVQHVGDNMLSLLGNLANATAISAIERESTGKSVYFDFMGWFLVNWSFFEATAGNLGGAVLSCLLGYKAIMDFKLGLSTHTVLYIARAMGGIVLGWLFAIICTIFTALLLDWTGCAMSWYGKPWLLFGLYIIPTIACSCLGILLMDKYNERKSLCVSIQTQIHLHAVRIIWTLVLVIGTCCGIRASYAVLIPVAFSMVAMLYVFLFRLLHTVHAWRLVYIATMTLALMFLQKEALKTVTLLIPITGRIGSDRNPELIIGPLVLFFTILSTSFYTPFVKIIKMPKLFLAGLAALYVLTLIAVFTPLGFPYNGDVDAPTPERFMTYHTSRVFRNQSNHIIKKDSGIFILNMDRNSPNSVRKYVKDFDKVKPLEGDCDLAIFCGLPLSSVRMVAIVEESTWIPSVQPVINEPINLKLVSRTAINNNTMRLYLSAMGPDRLTIYIRPKQNIELVGTNLTQQLPQNPAKWRDLPVYFIHHTSGKEIAPLNFYVDLHVFANWEEQQPLADIAMAGIYVHSRKNIITLQYQQFLASFPEWADVVPFLGSYENWVL